MSFFRYLFPKRRLKDQLPLLPNRYSSRRGNVDRRYADAIRLLKGHGAAKTDQDAMRLLKKHPGRSVLQIIAIAKRERVETPKLARAWERLKRLW